MNGFPVTGCVTWEHINALYEGIKARFELLDNCDGPRGRYWAYTARTGGFLDPGPPDYSIARWASKQNVLRTKYRASIINLAENYCKDPTDDELPPWTAQTLLEASCKAVFGPAWVYPNETPWQQWVNPFSDIWPWYVGEQLPHSVFAAVFHLQYDINVMAAALDRLSYPMARFRIGGFANKQWLDGQEQEEEWGYAPAIRTGEGISEGENIRTVHRGAISAMSPRNSLTTNGARWLSGLTSGKMRLVYSGGSYDVEGNPPSHRESILGASETSFTTATEFWNRGFTTVKSIPALETGMADITFDISAAGPYWKWKFGNESSPGVGKNVSATITEFMGDPIAFPEWAPHTWQNRRIVMLRGGGSLPDEPEDPEEPYEPGWP